MQIRESSGHVLLQSLIRQDVATHVVAMQLEQIASLLCGRARKIIETSDELGKRSRGLADVFRRIEIRHVLNRRLDLDDMIICTLSRDGAIVNVYSSLAERCLPCLARSKVVARPFSRPIRTCRSGVESDFEQVADDDEYLAELGRPPTEYLADESQSIVAENDSPDVGFRYSVNPYRGCSHGCAIATPGRTTSTSASAPGSISKPRCS